MTIRLKTGLVGLAAGALDHQESERKPNVLKTRELVGRRHEDIFHLKRFFGQVLFVGIPQHAFHRLAVFFHAIGPIIFPHNRFSAR